MLQPRYAEEHTDLVQQQKTTRDATPFSKEQKTESIMQNWTIEEKKNLHFCCDLQVEGSEFVVSNMNEWIYPDHKDQITLNWFLEYESIQLNPSGM